MSKFYAYVCGEDKGIVCSWDECKKKVEFKKGAKYKRFESYEDAQRWLSLGASYKERQKEVEREVLSKEAIYFDSGTGGKRGVEVKVSDHNGVPLTFLAVRKEHLTERGTLILEDKTNNYGELFALYLALIIANKIKAKKICGDSKLVIDYWSKGIVSDKKKKDVELIKLIEKTKRMREEFEKKGGVIERISGSLNPADIGYHKG